MSFFDHSGLQELNSISVKYKYLVLQIFKRVGMIFQNITCKFRNDDNCHKICCRIRRIQGKMKGVISTKQLLSMG